MADVPATTSYLSGLRLSGRRVVVVGGGRVAERRLERFLDAEALIEVIAPEATVGIQRLADQGLLTWTRRRYSVGDLDQAWYVLTATDDRDCNEAVSIEAAGLRIFCVRSDDRDEATAWTPATGEVDGVQVAILAGGDHRRSRRIRDAVLKVLIKVIGSERSSRAA